MTSKRETKRALNKRNQTYTVNRPDRVCDSCHWYCIQLPDEPDVCDMDLRNLKCVDGMYGVCDAWVVRHD